MESNTDILLIEDNSHEAELAFYALKHIQPLRTVCHVSDGAEALNMLLEQPNTTDHPRLILLDINLPKINGLDVLQALKTHQATRHIPVVILSNSDDEHDMATSRALQANGYVRKPIDLHQFMKVLSDTISAWI
jgi:CheY-like chemotaxis protein